MWLYGNKKVPRELAFWCGLFLMEVLIFPRFFNESCHQIAFSPLFAHCVLWLGTPSNIFSSIVLILELNGARFF